MSGRSNASSLGNDSAIRAAQAAANPNPMGSGFPMPQAQSATPAAAATNTPTPAATPAPAPAPQPSGSSDLLSIISKLGSLGEQGDEVAALVAEVMNGSNEAKSQMDELLAIIEEMKSSGSASKNQIAAALDAAKQAQTVQSDKLGSIIANLRKITQQQSDNKSLIQQKITDARAPMAGGKKSRRHAKKSHMRSKKQKGGYIIKSKKGRKSVGRKSITRRK